jgi:hypothetical protein
MVVAVFMISGFTCSVLAQGFKVDLDMSGRQQGEVHEPDYLSWIVKNQVEDNFALDENITVYLSTLNNGNLKSNWYKAGIAAAKLANDGVLVDGYTGFAQIEMRITGLSAGIHSILTYHNMVDNVAVGSFAPIDIYVNGVLSEESLVPTVRVEKNDDAAKFYSTFNVQQGGDVVILFKAKDIPAITNKTVILNAFEIDTRNANMQALNPTPLDRDEHVDADNGKNVVLRWQSPEGVISHDIYFGTNQEEVLNADRSSACFKGNQTGNTYEIGDLYSMSTYYWRIDEVGSTETTKGNVWYFRPRQLAFDGAEGYGRFARGGRGGKVVEVSDLRDDANNPIQGSLRWALQQHPGEPLIIVFTKSGIIELQDRLTINRRYVTVAGQTAPGKGICIKGKPFGLSGADDAVVRFMRVRVGGGQTTDGMGLNGCNYSIIDHSSISWTVDESFSSRSALNISFQRNMIAEPLNIAGHKNYGPGTAHGYAASIGGDVGSFHHNLLSQSAGRNWSMAGGLDGNGYYSGRLDLFNNVVYNWVGRTTDGGAHEVNFVNNYYKAGPASKQSNMLVAQLEGVGKGSQSYYVKGNVFEKANGTIACDGTNDECGRTYTKASTQVLDWTLWVDAPFFESQATIHSAKEAYKHVLSNVGANMPVFDDHDKRIVKETLSGVNTYTGSVGKLSGIPDDESDVGGWEDYGNVMRSADFDSDHDGLPDWWEILFNLNPNSPEGDFSDTNADVDGNGITWMDRYLDWMSTPHFELESTGVVSVNLKELSQGFEKYPAYSIVDMQNCTANIEGEIASVMTTSGDAGLGSFMFKVTDADGHSMTRKVGIRLLGSGSGITNPTNDGLNVSFVNPVGNTLRLYVHNENQTSIRFELSDIQGRNIAKSEYAAGTNEIVKDMSILSEGIYVAKIIAGDKTRIIKIIKN